MYLLWNTLGMHTSMTPFILQISLIIEVGSQQRYQVVIKIQNTFLFARTENIHCTHQRGFIPTILYSFGIS